MSNRATFTSENLAHFHPTPSLSRGGVGARTLGNIILPIGPNVSIPPLSLSHRITIPLSPSVPLSNSGQPCINNDTLYR